MRHISSSRRSFPKRPAPGMSLIELMIALVLGLLVAGAASALFITNRQTYSTTESIGRIQENARVAFELMARDLREAAGNACGTPLSNTVSVVNPDGDGFNWYTDFAGGIRGYPGTEAFADSPFGTGAAERVEGTDAIDLKSSLSSGVTIEEHQPTSAQFKVNTTGHDLNDGDIVMVCDSNHAAILQITNASPGTNVTVVHNTGGSVKPGNCTKGLGTGCDTNPTVNGSSYEFGCAFGGVSPGIDCNLPENKWTASIAKLKATRWFIGYNGRNGKSLYQSTLRNQGGVLGVETNEITEGVENMSLRYLMQGEPDYQAASGGIDWDRVTAVRVDLTMIGEGKVGTDGKPLTRRLEHVVTIRNRAP